MANPQGTPIWFEYTSDDPDKAQAFYEAVAGWTLGASMGPEFANYRLATAADGVDIGGFMPTMKDMEGMPGWALYFAADDVDALTERVEALGGRLHFGPHDIPNVGRFATVADPQGVPFHIMRGNSDEASRAFVPTPGAASEGHGVWVELATPDPEGAFDFYGELFGWTKAGAMPMGEMGEYAFIGVEGSANPGAVMSSARTGAPARWNWYVRVPDIDAALAAGAANGGTVIQGPDPIPGGDYSANLTDNQGHQIGLTGPRRN